MRKWWNVAAVLVGVAVLATTLYVTAQPAEPPAALRIGFVDFERLITQYDKMKDAKGELDALKKEVETELEKRSKELDQLHALLQQSQPGTEAYNKTSDEINAKKATTQAWMNRQQMRYAERSGALMKEIYQDAERAAAVYAKLNGISLVLKDDPVKTDVPNPGEVELRITLRKVLYCNESLDITDELAVSMNAVYKKTKEGP